VQITEIAPNSPAQTAGIEAGDKIIAVKSQTAAENINTVSVFQDLISANKGKELLITLQRGQQELEVKAVPRLEIPAGEGALGIGLVRVAEIYYPWYQSFWEGTKETFALIWLTLSAFGYMLWQLIGHGQAVAEVAGPVGIYTITGQVVQMGFVYIIQLAALLSVNLAIINAFPFPALDGGRVLFLIIEKIKGSPVSQAVERGVHTAGFVFLLLLMLLITARDVIKLF
jgi:regulator of sigma E protease